MVIFFDSLHYKINKDNYSIFYFQFINKLIKLKYHNAYLLSKILEYKSPLNTDDLDLRIYGFSSEYINSFVDKMIDLKFFFKTEAELVESDFKYTYENQSNIIGLEKIYCHLTQNCNLSCSYCYNIKNLNCDRKELTTDEWINKIKEFILIGVKEIVFTGGEVLLRKDLVDILESLRKYNVKTIILTNGTLLDTSRGKKVLDLVDKVIVSLDSINHDMNDKYRVNSIKYNILETLSNLRLYSDKISVRAVVGYHNFHDVSKLKEYVVNELGMKFIKSKLLPNNIREIGSFCPDFSNFYDKDEIGNISKCGACKQIFAIDSNGDFYPCQTMIRPEMKIGNIISDNLKDLVVNADDKFGFGVSVNYIKECDKCVFKYICGGGCKALNYNLYHKLNLKNDFLCDLYKYQCIKKIENLY